MNNVICNDKKFLLTFLTVFAVAWFTCYIYYQYTHDSGFLLDFEPYYLQSKAMHQGHPLPYDVRGTKLGWNLETTLPLLYSFLLTPISFFKLQQAEKIFLVLNICLYLLGVFLLQKSISLSHEKKILLWCISLTFFPAVHGLHVGNVSVILFVLVSLSLYAFQKKKPIASAIILGFAASIKITPGFLIVIFFTHKNFKYCCYFTLTFLFSQAITAQITGWDNAFYYWLELFPRMNQYSCTAIYNQSIAGYLARVYSNLHIDFPTYINQIVALSVLGSFTGYMALKNKFFNFHNKSLKEDRETIFFEISIMLILINLSTPYGWPHHFVWLMIPIAYLLKMADIGTLEEHDIVLITIASILFFIPIEDINFYNKGFYLLNIVKCGHILTGSLILLFELFKLQSIKKIAL